ncbi:mitochondrial import inner membrane translocase subunit TIM16 [Phytophthora boehmeriae]|uniref:Mitochondrial import inner membrane translocase subunit TIM16 n=1 Tax=Phytophthora boehmeriae TaxID=109152 RepID=A0A8T1X103_9STRA|nr:mitochondrial import inner membrane translocase subunit TIM16 [Phytophthora boehmeriae]
MSGPLGRIVAQVVVMGAGIVSKAFVQAYQQAVHNARSGNAGAMAAKTVVRKNKMSKQQALEVLNFPTSGPAPSSEEIQKQFTRYFEANDPAKGGSFYLQSKIFRAKEALETKDPEEGAPPSDKEKSM